MKYSLIRFDKTVALNATEKTGNSPNVGEEIMTGENCNGFLEKIMESDLEKYCFQVHCRIKHVIHSVSVGEFEFEKIERQQNKEIANGAKLFLEQLKSVGDLVASKENKLTELYTKALHKK